MLTHVTLAQPYFTVILHGIRCSSISPVFNLLTALHELLHDVLLFLYQSDVNISIDGFLA